MFLSQVFPPQNTRFWGFYLPRFTGDPADGLPGRGYRLLVRESSSLGLVDHERTSHHSMV
jgi:hypothetical protein